MGNLKIMTPTKQQRSKEIAECVSKISSYYGIDPMKVMTAFSNKCNRISEARNLLWFHLHDCGMSYDAIGRIWKLSCDHIAKRVKQGSITLLPDDLLLLKTLPRISSTLEIGRVENT